MEDFGSIINLIKMYGYWVIAVGIFLECMGVPFPGETVLILGGVGASLGHLNLAAVIIIAIIAAVAGDNVGYIIGKKFGRKIIKKFEHLPLFHYKHIERAEGFFRRHGNKTVFIGRFTAILRTYAAVLAGVFGMEHKIFFFYNVTGGIVWAIIFGVLGYIIGNNLPLLGEIISDVNVVVLSVVGLFVGWKIVNMVRKNMAAKAAKEAPVTKVQFMTPAKVEPLQD